MARRPSTSTDSARSNEADSTAGNANDASAAEGAAGGGVGAGTAEGATEGANAQGGGNSPPPVRRRKRGPNKPKPGAFTVETKAHMKHEEILKLLTAHAVAQLGGEVATHMVLQVNVDGECQPLGDLLPPGATLQFSTVKMDK